MAQKVRRQRKYLAPNFNLGNDVAESDPLLDDAFYDSAVFQAVQSSSLSARRSSDISRITRR